MRSPHLLYASVSREKGTGARVVGLSRFENVLGFCMWRLFCDIGVYLVGAVFEVRFRAVTSQQPVFVILGAFPVRPTFVTYYPVYEIGLNFRLSLVWMVQIG